MAWVQVGPHKINTALVCFVEQEGETVRIYFHGEWEGNPLDLHFDEAKYFWRHLKAEDVMLASRDKGSATVLAARRVIAIQGNFGNVRCRYQRRRGAKAQNTRTAEPRHTQAAGTS